jgi:translocation and assembly module TamB
MSSESSFQKQPEKQLEKQSEKKQYSSNLIRKFAIGITKLWLVLVFVACFLIGLLLTPWGTQALVNTMNNLVDELTIDYQSGGIGAELHLSSVKWERLSNQVDINNLRLSIQLSCVWKFALCIDSISLDKMMLQTQASGTASGAEPAASVITLPFPVSIKHLSFNEFSLKIQDTADITWQKLTGKLDFYQRLRIEKMQLDGFNLTTYATQTSQVATQAKPFDWTKWQYQPITPLPIVLPIHFDVLAFNMSDASVQLAGQPQIKIEKVSLKAEANKKTLQLHKLFIKHQQGRLSAEGNVQLNGDFKHVISIDASANINAKVNAKANTKLEKQIPLQFTLRSSGNINALTTQFELMETHLPVVTPADVSQIKPLKLVVDLVAQPSKATLPVKIRLKWNQLAWPLIKPEVKSETGVVDINGDLNRLNISIQTSLTGQNIPDVDINFSAVAASTAQNKSFELNTFLLETLGGQVLSQGELTFSEYINWQGSSVITHLDPSIFWPELVADINGEVSTQANNSQGIWKAKLTKLDINGQWQNYPLSTSGSIDFHQNDGLQLRTLLLKNANNILSLDGVISKQQKLDLKFKLDAKDLTSTLPQLGGTLNLAGNISGSFKQPEVSYELLGNDLLVAGVFVEQAVSEGHIKWDKQKPIVLNLELTGIQGINNQIDNAQIIVSGDASAHQLDLTTSGQSTSVDLSIQGKLNQTSWQGTWLSGEIESSYTNLTLLEPFKIEADWAKQEYFIAPHCWRHTENELCIKKASFNKNTMIWDVSLKEFDVLSVVQRLAPGIPLIKTRSRLNLDISGDWDIRQLPSVSLSASLSPADWVFSEKNNLQFTLDKTSVEAKLTPKNILANIQLSGEKIGSVSANVLGQSGVYADPLTRPIQGELLIARFDLAALKALVPQLDVLQGDINGQAQIDGTLGKPLLSGELKLANGALKDETLPVALSAIEQSIILKGQQAEFEGSYKLGKGLGRLNGKVAWIPALKGNIQVSGKELEFDYQNVIKAKVSPNINFIFEPNNLEINGEITVPFARVLVRELPKGSISPSKDVILVEQQAELAASQQRLTLNVLLKVDPLRSNTVKLDAFGLTTDLQGELRLQNNKSEIFSSGIMQLVNGRYRAYGQNLIIREGDILFNSTLERPFLNIEAVRDPKLTSNSVIAGLRVEGAAQNPAISVFSEPDMEQQQILSYLLTGRGIGESNSDSQDTILTNALLSFGLGKSENLISKVGNKLGFEDVNLDTSGQGESTQLSLTGTIAPGVQLRYGVGVFEPIPEVAIRYELIPKLYIEAVSGVSNAIDIYYQFSIEGSQNKQSKQAIQR